jgi:hypothetical protein
MAAMILPRTVPASRSRMAPEQTAAIAETFLGQFPAHQFPHLAELTTQHVMRPGYDYGDEFDFGLDLILDGLERECTSRRAERARTTRRKT